MHIFRQNSLNYVYIRYLVTNTLKKDTNNEDFWELLYAEAFGTLSPHLTLGTGRLLVAVENLFSGEVL